jgi:PAS domain S-box-containing protein
VRPLPYTLSTITYTLIMLERAILAWASSSPRGRRWALEFFSRLFDSDFMPHGACFFWRPEILWLHVLSDGGIALAYYAIPAFLLSIQRKRPDLPFRKLFVFFSAFIIACGTTHVLEIWTLWHGTYRLVGLVKLLTALTSLATLAVLGAAIPKILALPSQNELKLLNAALEQEIRERQRGERASLEAAHLAGFRTLFDHNPAPMYVFDVESLRFLEVNETAVERYGYSREEFLSMSIAQIRPPEDLKRLRSALETLPSDSSLSLSGGWRHLLKNGTLIHVDVFSRALVYEGRRARLVLAIDVTDRIGLQDRLVRSERLEAVGLLAGGVAHDFNNILTAILGYGSALERRVEKDAEAGRYAREIGRAAQRAADLTRQLLAFSRQQVLERAVFDLRALLEDLTGMLRRLISEEIEFQSHMSPHPCLVMADRSQLEQVIMNLAVNARDAMPGGGTLTLAVETVETDDAYAQNHAGMAAGRYVMLSVTDTGTGMDPEMQARIFEPFFTTKEVGKGTGLGLATVYGIVKQMGGFIWVYSEVDQGTVFKIYLPQVESVGEIAEVPKDEAVLESGTGTILLVEDEEAVRSLLRELLESAGYRVIAAVNGEEALLLETQTLEPIDLLVTDMVMPRMNGRDLARRLVAARPELKVLYMSGYAFSSVPDAGLKAGESFLQKPFTASALMTSVGHLLGKAPGSG